MKYKKIVLMSAAVINVVALSNAMAMQAQVMNISDRCECQIDQASEKLQCRVAPSAGMTIEVLGKKVKSESDWADAVRISPNQTGAVESPIGFASARVVSKKTWSESAPGVFGKSNVAVKLEVSDAPDALPFLLNRAFFDIDTCQPTFPGAWAKASIMHAK